MSSDYEIVLSELICRGLRLHGDECADWLRPDGEVETFTPRYVLPAAFKVYACVPLEFNPITFALCADRETGAIDTRATVRKLCKRRGCANAAHYMLRYRSDKEQDAREQFMVHISQLPPDEAAEIVKQRLEERFRLREERKRVARVARIKQRAIKSAEALTARRRERQAY